MLNILEAQGIYFVCIVAFTSCNYGRFTFGFFDVGKGSAASNPAVLLTEGAS
ncbi:hypothetical protein [Trichormus azollae]|uniref:hypothetical protein n=1 Tax=Trichormus azollae TaxID=1164 RepID=UPI001650E1B8|nr:hypothetical protein [Trichormus azollae]